MDAARARWGLAGITFGATYTGEVLSNVAGGLRRDSIYQGKLELSVQADLERILGWQDVTLFANVFQIHGTGGVGRDLTGSLITISNIEALPTTRLSELWLEKKINNVFNIRFGQLAADAEFFISDVSTMFINSDWPAITAENLPSGGPAYPFATPGIRLKADLRDDTSLLLAVFNGDPAGPGADDAERRNRYGTNFRVSDPPLAMAEGQFYYNQSASARGLAGKIRLGAWYHFGGFDDQRFGTDGLSLANPASNGTAVPLRGNRGIYGVIDQQIYRPTGGDAQSGISIFSRVSASPSDRNLINVYADGGVVFSGFVPTRPNDKFGATVLYSSISDRLRGLDQDIVAFGTTGYPVRRYEMTMTLAYQAQIAPNWTLQPEVQYIVYPGGYVPNPFAAVPNAPINDALVIGLRTVAKY